MKWKLINQYSFNSQTDLFGSSFRPITHFYLQPIRCHFTIKPSNKSFKVRHVNLIIKVALWLGIIVVLGNLRCLKDDWRSRSLNHNPLILSLMPWPLGHGSPYIKFYHFCQIQIYPSLRKQGKGGSLEIL